MMWCSEVTCTGNGGNRLTLTIGRRGGRSLSSSSRSTGPSGGTSSPVSSSSLKLCWIYHLLLGENKEILHDKKE